MPTNELATSTPIVPTTMRWIHCLAARADFDSTAVIFQMNAKMNAIGELQPGSQEYQMRGVAVGVPGWAYIAGSLVNADRQPAEQK